MWRLDDSLSDRLPVLLTCRGAGNLLGNSSITHLNTASQVGQALISRAGSTGRCNTLRIKLFSSNALFRDRWETCPVHSHVRGRFNAVFYDPAVIAWDRLRPRLSA